MGKFCTKDCHMATFSKVSICLLQLQQIVKARRKHPALTAAKLQPAASYTIFLLAFFSQRSQVLSSGCSPSLDYKFPVPNPQLKTETNPSCDSSGRKLLLQASLKGAWMNLETGSSWFSIRLFCAAGIYRAVKGVSCQQNLCVWLGKQHPLPQRMSGIDKRTDSQHLS